MLRKLNNAVIDKLAIDNDDLEVNKAILNGTKPEEAVNEHDKKIKRDSELYLLIFGILMISGGNYIGLKEKRLYAPIIALKSMYPVKAPKLFVNKMLKILNGGKLNGKEKRALQLVRVYKKMNAKVLIKIQVELKKHRIASKSYIYADVKNGGLSKKELVDKYGSKKRVNRALRTERHAEIESNKIMVAKEHGYTKKTWKTKGDSRVRKTTWHNGVANKTVDIGSDFKVAGMRASYPGDERLPIGERINCRCYLLLE